MEHTTKQVVKLLILCFLVQFVPSAFAIDSLRETNQTNWTPTISLSEPVVVAMVDTKSGKDIYTGKPYQLKPGEYFDPEAESTDPVTYVWSDHPDAKAINLTVQEEGE